jgi:hypothetical protein
MDSRSVGVIGPAAATELVREALRGAGFRLTWIEGPDAGPAEVLLWVVAVETGVPEGA